MTERTVLERYTDAVAVALVLPTPRLIARSILAGTPEVDDGLRAANYDGDKVTGGAGGSHVERMVAQRNPGQFPKDEAKTKDGRDWEHIDGTWGRGARHNLRPSDELLRLSKASERAVEAVANLLAEVLDAGCPDLDDYGWDDAIKDAHLIAEDHNGETLRAAIDLGRDVTKWSDRFSHAIDTVRAVRDSWMPHDAPQGLENENEAWCRPCLRLGVKRQRITRICCQRCWRDILDLEGFITDDDGNTVPAVELQLNPAYWPSEAMGRAREDSRRVLLDRERQAWLRSHGADPLLVQRRRQDRRSA